MTTPDSRLAYPAFHRLVPGVAPGLTAVSKAAAASGLEASLLELVKLRASQINGCTFCLAYHLAEARRLEVPSAKLDLLAAWADAPLFTVRERAALAWTETLTRLVPPHPVPDAAYQAVAAVFPPGELAGLTTAVALINAWNRLGIGFAFAPPAA